MCDGEAGKDVNKAAECTYFVDHTGGSPGDRFKGT